MTASGSAPVLIRVASRNDNAALLALTATSSMGGRIGVRIDREPDFFGLLDRRGRSVLLVAEQGNALVGCLSATAVPVYVDGRADTVWFLGDFKAAPRHRGSGLAVRLLRRMHQRIRDEGPDIVLGLTAADNELVRPFHGGRAGLLQTVPMGGFRVLQIIPTLRAPRPRDVRVAIEPLAADVEALYTRWAKGYQFAPVVGAEYLAGARHLVARSLRGELLAGVSLADVSAVRQNVLVRAPWLLRATSAALRHAARVMPIVPPPRVGEPIRTLYVTAMGVCDGCETALDSVLEHARYVAGEGRYHFLSLGFHERDPLGARFRRLPAFTFDVSGFLVSLRGDADGLRPLLDRVPFQDFSLG